MNPNCMSGHGGSLEFGSKASRFFGQGVWAKAKGSGLRVILASILRCEGVCML